MFSHEGECACSPLEVAGYRLSIRTLVQSSVQLHTKPSRPQPEATDVSGQNTRQLLGWMCPERADCSFLLSWDSASFAACTTCESHTNNCFQHLSGVQALPREVNIVSLEPSSQAGTSTSTQSGKEDRKAQEDMFTCSCAKLVGEIGCSPCQGT